MADKTFKESFKVAGSQLVDAVKKLLHEGNVRRVIIKHETRTIAEFPLTVGVIGAVLAPILAAVAAIATVMGECTVEVDRTSPDEGTVSSESDSKKGAA